jgi:hypothetical protein
VDTTEDTVGEDKDLARFRQLFKEDHDARLEWAKEAVIDYAFHAGHGQWDEADKIKLKDQQRPCITFNRIAPVVASVVGQEINQRAEVTYKPRTTQTAEQGNPMGMGQPGMAAPMQAPVPGADDTGPAETITAAAAYLRDQCDAEDEESDAFQDNVICGMGWVETRVSHDENPDGDLVEDRIDPLEMLWDCKAQKRNVVDARRVWRVREIDKHEAKEMFPGKDMSLLDASWARMDKTTQPHDREAARFYESEQAEDYDPNRKTVTLVECQYYVTETVFKSVDIQTGGEVEFKTQKEADNYAKNAFTVTGKQVPVAKHKKRVYRTAIIGREVLSDEESQSQECFKYQAITGYRDRNSKQWVGLVRAMRDPQRWANALFSSVLHQIQTTGKGIMAERGAFEDAQKAEKDWANGSKVVWLNSGAVAGQMIQQKEQHQLPQGIFDLMQFSLTTFRDVTGVNIEAMGLADRTQAASLEYQRRQAATTILAPFFDGLRRFRKENGRLILDLIRNFLSDGRLVRVVGPDYEKYVPLIKQDDTIDYDIIVDESPSSPNQKEATWAVLQQMLPVLADKLTPATTSILLKASPLPESTVNEFSKKAQEEAANAGPSPEQQKAELEMAKMQGDMQMQQQDHQAQLMIAQQKAEQDGAKAAADIQLKQMDIMIKEMEIKLAEFQAGIDLKTAMFDADMKKTEMGFKHQEMQGKSQESKAQRDHDKQMRSMEIDGNLNAEMVKNPEAMGSMTTGLSKGLEAVAQALLESNKGVSEGLKAMAEGQSAVAKALMAPKVSTMSPDGMTATTRPA